MEEFRYALGAGVGLEAGEEVWTSRVWTVWLGWWELARVNCRSGSKWASIGLAQEALVGAKKHSSTLCFFAQRRIFAPVWAERLSRMM